MEDFVSKADYAGNAIMVYSPAGPGETILVSIFNQEGPENQSVLLSGGQARKLAKALRAAADVVKPKKAAECGICGLLECDECAGCIQDRNG